MATYTLTARSKETTQLNHDEPGHRKKKKKKKKKKKQTPTN